MSRQLTLIGRLGPIAYQEPPNGSAHASFDIIISRGSKTTPVPCEAWGILAEQAFSMDEGSLIGLIGTLTIDRTVRIETLEHLGRPL
jgi:hypothetical protein